MGLSDPARSVKIVSAKRHATSSGGRGDMTEMNALRVLISFFSSPAEIGGAGALPNNLNEAIDILERHAAKPGGLGTIRWMS
jgi:hypothetical protein